MRVTCNLVQKGIVADGVLHGISSGYFILVNTMITFCLLFLVFMTIY